MKNELFLFTILLFLIGCSSQETSALSVEETEIEQATEEIKNRIEEYSEFELTADLSHLSVNQKKMLGLIIEACQIMDTLYAKQSYGDLNKLLAEHPNQTIQKFIEINQGPWDRLRNNEPFIDGIGEKAWGANLYPQDMTKQEFNSSEFPGKEDMFTSIRRDASGHLMAVPFHQEHQQSIQRVAEILRKAAGYAEDDGFRNYLILLADAIEVDDYEKSEEAWLLLNNCDINLILGPVETYEDELFRLKTTYTGFILLRDWKWNKDMKRYIKMLPSLFDEIPIANEYRRQIQVREMRINAYDALYYAGSANVGRKTITLNLPNSGSLRARLGSRSMQMKNIIHAKFDHILLPITNVMMAKEQRKYVQFETFFTSTMFREMTSSIVMKHTLKGQEVKEALKEYSSIMMNVKNDAYEFYLVHKLIEQGELAIDLKSYYTTFIASIFRNVRVGTGDDFSIANIIRFNFFFEREAFRRMGDGTYEINFSKIPKVASEYLQLVLKIQGDGDYAAAANLIRRYGQINRELQYDLFKLQDEKIPIDLYLKQGREVLGL